MRDGQALLDEAIEQHRIGNFDAAYVLYNRVLAVQPDHWDALYLSGTALLQLGRYEDCIAVLKRVVDARPDVADAANNLGIAFEALGRDDEAAHCFEAAIRARPEYSQAHFNLGRLFERRKSIQQAERCYREVLQIDAGDVTARFRLASLLWHQNRLHESERWYRDVLFYDPTHVDALVNLGGVLAELNRFPEAAACFEQVVAWRPDYHQVHSNLSNVYEAQGRIPAAIAAARRSVELRPDYAAGWNHLGVAKRSSHEIDGAVDAFCKSLQLEPNVALAEFNLGATLLLAERYREGWPYYARGVERLCSVSDHAALPRWNAEPLNGRTLFVYADQGFGDTIQFSRFLKEAKERSSGTVVFECQPKLRELMATCAGADRVVEPNSSCVEADAQIPLAALPGLLGVGADDLGLCVPYLRSEFEPSPEILKRVSRADRFSKTVGLVWQGNPKQARDFVRSCPFEKLRPLLELSHVLFVSLQVDEPGRKQLSEAFPAKRPANLVDASEFLEGFSATAAVMKVLDLVVTVDTAIAHLAGALGLPVWTMLCHTPDWRWHLDRTDSPWYPTMRLFRQPNWGDWDAVVHEVADSLG